MYTLTTETGKLWTTRNSKRSLLNWLKALKPKPPSISFTDFHLTLWEIICILLLACSDPHVISLRTTDRCRQRGHHKPDSTVLCTTVWPQQKRNGRLYGLCRADNQAQYTCQPVIKDSVFRYIQNRYSPDTKMLLKSVSAARLIWRVTS